MSQGSDWNVPSPAHGRPARNRPAADPASLADILERVLDKGIVIAGDIQINLLDIELLTIKLRLLVASVDRAKEMGIDWWEHDPTLSSGARDVLDENERLRRRVGELEAGQRARADAARAGGRTVTEGPLPPGLRGDRGPRRERRPARGSPAWRTNRCGRSRTPGWPPW